MNFYVFCYAIFICLLVDGAFYLALGNPFTRWDLAVTLIISIAFGVWYKE